MEYYNISGLSRSESESDVEDSHEPSMTEEASDEAHSQVQSCLKQAKLEGDKTQAETNQTSLENHTVHSEDEKTETLEERWDKIDRERLETINRQGQEIEELKIKLSQLHERCIAVENVVKLYLKSENCPSQTGGKETSLETRLAALEMALGKAVNYMFPRMDEVLSKIEESSGGAFASFSTFTPRNSASNKSVRSEKDDVRHNDQTVHNRMTNSHTMSSHHDTTSTSILFTSPSDSYLEPSITFEVADDTHQISQSSFSSTLNSHQTKSGDEVSKSAQPQLNSILLDPTLLRATEKNTEVILVASDTQPYPSTTGSVSSTSSLPSVSSEIHTSDEDVNGSDLDVYPYSISPEYPPSPTLTSSLAAIVTPPPAPPPRPLPADLDSALRDAAKEGNADEICRLLLAGAEADAGDNLKTTALHWAAIKGHLQAASALLEGDADVNCRDVSGWTPLHFAASKGHAPVLAFLLRRGAALASMDDKHWTPLHVAIHGGHVECVRALLDAGADPFAADATGKKMLDLSDSEAVRQLLLGYMGKNSQLS